MKKTSLLLIVICSTFVFAASSFAKGVSAAGIKLGTTATTVTGKTFEVPSTSWYSSEQYMKPNFAASLFMTYDFTNRIAIQPELTFQIKQFQESWKLAAGDHKQIYSLDYLTVPVLAKFLLNPKINWNPSLYIGPEFAVMVGSNVRHINLDNVFKDYHIANRKAYDVLVTLGHDGGWTVNDFRLFYDFRFNYSTIDFLKKVDPAYFYKKGFRPLEPGSANQPGDLLKARKSVDEVYIHTYDDQNREAEPSAKLMTFCFMVGFSF